MSVPAAVAVCCDVVRVLAEHVTGNGSVSINRSDRRLQKLFSLCLKLVIKTTPWTAHDTNSSGS